MPTETPTLPPHPSLADPSQAEHGFTFAEPNSRFAQEFAGAYQESLAQVRAESAAAAERAATTSPATAPNVTEALDLADIRAEVDKLTSQAEREAATTADTVAAPLRIAPADQLPMSVNVDAQPAGPLKRAAATSRQRAANLVYTYLGNKTPKFVKNHVPVYRAVSKTNAGYGNRWDVSEWTIGAGKGPRKHALEWVQNHTYDPANPETAHLQDADEYVAIQSTLGELERSGSSEVRHYGEYGSSRKKVVLHHANPSQPVAHRVIASNKRAA